MKILSKNLKKGKTFRKVIYINGKKHYVVLKVIAIQSYKRSHGQDIRRKAKDEK